MRLGMKKYFDIFIEFDYEVIESVIDKGIKDGNKGYVCVVDGNVLANSVSDSQYKDIVNGAIINTCDGSSIALIAGIIHRQNFVTYTGPQIFSKYVKEKYKQYFLGNTEKNLASLLSSFSELGYCVDQFIFEPLPFQSVQDFDYAAIARNINKFCPDIIWVSLGAPKQEIFISKLYPYLNGGILIAIGAAFNLFIEDKENKRTPKALRRLHLEWLFRVIKEPERVGKRALNYLFLLPRLIFEEIKRTNVRNNYL